MSSFSHLPAQPPLSLSLLLLSSNFSPSSVVWKLDKWIEEDTSSSSFSPSSSLISWSLKLGKISRISFKGLQAQKRVSNWGFLSQDQANKGGSCELISKQGKYTQLS
eukprot:TRINITY_DN8464_c0_g1_i5.p1 TRINITY_DN8464_c0_g1~~TRINITY_DN8464_c0_g1_i5.p1  ORF type:complete len:107 (-),score=25.97 TRINITY_DN8464_c0_g1_i5:666-986(-)